MTGPTVESNADLPEHQVAVVVFATVRAVDAADAASLVESAVRKAFRDAPGDFDGAHGKSIYFDKPTKAVHWRVPVVVRSVHEVTRAALNGYLAVQATRRGYPEVPE